MPGTVNIAVCVAQYVHVGPPPVAAQVFRDRIHLHSSNHFKQTRSDHLCGVHLCGVHGVRLCQSLVAYTREVDITVLRDGEAMDMSVYFLRPTLVPPHLSATADPAYLVVSRTSSLL
jgi:hypothetical protein